MPVWVKSLTISPSPPAYSITSFFLSTATFFQTSHLHLTLLTNPRSLLSKSQYSRVLHWWDLGVAMLSPHPQHLAHLFWITTVVYRMAIQLLLFALSTRVCCMRTVWVKMTRARKARQGHWEPALHWVPYKVQGKQNWEHGQLIARKWVQSWVIGG